MDKHCKACNGTTDFYETQKSLYCRPCFTQRYVQVGRDRLLQEKLLREKCMDCGLVVTEENACVFDFDHLGEKRWNVSKMMSCSNKSFTSEVAKCEMVCSNCHRIRTRKRGRHWKKGGRPRKDHPRDLMPLL